MIAVDINVWVRYVTNDDPKQAEQALKLLESAQGVFVAKTVLLELEWVLRAVYGLTPAAIYKAMMQIVGLPVVQVEAAGQVAKALEFYTHGIDFADALHLVGSEQVEAFYTFDLQFVRKAKKCWGIVKKV